MQSPRDTKLSKPLTALLPITTMTGNRAIVSGDKLVTCYSTYSQLCRLYHAETQKAVSNTASKTKFKTNKNNNKKKKRKKRERKKKKEQILA